MERTSGIIKTRYPIIEGIFYTDIKEDLIKQLDDEISKAKANLSSSQKATSLPAAILSPHAAFEYSVGIQATAWASVSDCPVENVVIVAQSLSHNETGIYLPESSIFSVSPGDIQINTILCKDLESCSTLFKVDDIPHLENNAIEMQALFMKTLFPYAKLIPILIKGDISTIAALGRGLDLVFSDKLSNTLFVSSSNLISSEDAKESEALSTQILLSMSAGNWLDIASRKYLSGKDAIASIMSLRALSKMHFNLLARTDSRKCSKDKALKTVNYAAALWN